MDIPGAVCSGIRRLGECRVYTEALPQGFKAPCFFVREVRRTSVRTVGERFRQRVEVEIVYYPKDKLNPREECYAVSNALFEQMEFVKTDEGLIHGVDKRSEVNDGVLKFRVSFDFFIVGRKDAEKMERLEYNGSAKSRFVS